MISYWRYILCINKHSLWGNGYVVPFKFPSTQVRTMYGVLVVMDTSVQVRCLYIPLNLSATAAPLNIVSACVNVCSARYIYMCIWYRLSMFDFSSYSLTHLHTHTVYNIYLHDTPIIMCTYSLYLSRILFSVYTACLAMCHEHCKNHIISTQPCVPLVSRVLADPLPPAPLPPGRPPPPHPQSHLPPQFI